MKLVFSRAAKADLANIWDYTVAKWSADQATRYIRNIQDACSAIAAGERSTQSAEYIRAGYRKAHVGRHTLYLIPHDDGIEIIRILHQSMDVEDKFGYDAAV